MIVCVCTPSGVDIDTRPRTSKQTRMDTDYNWFNIKLKFPINLINGVPERERLRHSIISPPHAATAYQTRYHSITLHSAATEQSAVDNGRRPSLTFLQEISTRGPRKHYIHDTNTEQFVTKRRLTSPVLQAKTWFTRQLWNCSVRNNIKTVELKTMAQLHLTEHDATIITSDNTTTMLKRHHIDVRLSCDLSNGNITRS